MADQAPPMGLSDSTDSRDDKMNEKKKSRRPANTAFRQQRLKAWQPILTPKTVLPLFFAIGIIFAPIGGLLLYASSQVQELRIDYTHCFDRAPTDALGPMDSGDIYSAFHTSNSSINAQWKRSTTNYTYSGDYAVQNLTKCTLVFHIPEDMGPPVLFFYQLTNFYQNHRRYVNSFYDKQLKGDNVNDQSSVDKSSCTPLTSNNSIAYYPCGLIANSVFNDTFMQPVMLNVIGAADKNETYVMQDTVNIAWTSDLDLYGKTQTTNYSSIMPPPNWQIRYPGGVYSNDHPPPDISKDQHFIVWMRTAGLPSFSKIYMRNDTTAMTTGDYQVDIIDNFRTDVYQGTKSIVISTRTVMGGRNPFLGIAYIVVAGVCVLLGGIFTVTHLLKPRKLGDHTYLSWNNAPGGGGKSSTTPGPSTGMATGRDLA